MFNKARTKALLIVVIALALIWFIGDHFGMCSKERTFHDVVMTIDTADVRSFTISAQRHDRIPMRFYRDGPVWRLAAGGDTLRVERKAVQDVLGPLGDLRVKRLVGMMGLVKDRYELTDTLCERLTVELSNGETRELLVGKSTFSPKDTWSHVSIPGEKEVFAIDGKLSMATEMKVEDWRPRTVVKGDPKHWTKLHFTFPGNDYVMERINGAWTLDGGTADTARIGKYLASLANSDAHFIAKGASIEGAPVVGRLEITDTSRPEPILVEVHPSPDGRFILHSSVNPENLLWFDAERELPRLFRPRDNWLVGATPTGPPN